LIFEPTVIESFGRNPEKSYGLFSRLLKDRVILVSGEITEDLSTIICAQLLYLEQQNPDNPIYMYINSPGGSVTAGLAIFDTMNFISCPVYTIGMGECMSMGSFLLTAGTKSFSLPNTSIMYHSVSSGFMGTVHDHEKHYLETQRLQVLLMDFLTKKIQKTYPEKDQDYIKNKTARDWYLTAQETKEEGLIDYIISNREDVKKFLS